MRLLSLLRFHREPEIKTGETPSEQSKIARELRSEEEVFSADMIEMYDTDPRWDTVGRVAAARAFLRQGWTLANVEEVYGKDVTAAAEESLLHSKAGTAS